METLPFTTLELIKMLDRSIPHRVPDLNENDRDIWFYAGRRAVVDQLITVAQHEQNVNINEIQEEVSNTINS